MLEETTSLYAMLSLDGVGLLLPQNEILSLESVMDLQAATAAEQIQLGVLPFQEQLIPVFCISREMTVLTERPATRRVCVILEHEQQRFALLCDQMLPLQRDAVTFSEIPVCMHQLDMLYTSLAIFEQSLAFVTSTAVLAEFLDI